MNRAIRFEYLILLFSVLMMLGYNQGLWEVDVQANQSIGLYMSILAVGLITAFFYQDYASTFRNHRDQASLGGYTVC